MSRIRTFRRRQGRRYWFLGATVVVAAVFGVVFVAASGANLTGSTFEGNDGNMIVDTPGHTDWANVAGLQTLIDNPSGSTDNSFTQGTSEDNTAVTIADGSIPPNKNDLTRAYLASEQVGGQSFLYLAWERLVNIGSANVDFELDQNATSGFTGSTTGAVTLNRTEGDLLITYDFGGSGTPTIGMLKWLTNNGTNTNSDCSKSGQTLPCWGDQITFSSSVAEAAVNTGTIQETQLNTSLTAGLFGEASINLSNALIAAGFNPDTCQQFGSVFVKSRSSGSSFDSELKDFIAPAPIHVSNCASPTIATQLSESTGSIGDTVHDSATLSGATGTAGGTVTYNVYTDSACTQGKQDAGTVNVTNGQVSDSNGIQFNNAGTWYWQAVYSGDNHNNSATSTCTEEQLVINPNTPAISTLLSNLGPISIGGSVHDSATLTGETADAGGTVKYAFYSSLSDCTAGTYAAPGGTSLGSVTVTNGSVPDSNSTGPINAAGTYYFRAFYSGDANNTGPVSSACADETLMVSPNTPAVSTQLSESTGNVGDTVHDSATINGATSDAGGTITYAVYSDNECRNLLADLTPADNKVVDGVAPDSLDHTFNSAGTFYFQATYSGDSNNTGPVSSPCESEKLVISPADVSITKTADHSTPVNAGQQIGFTVEVKNTGVGDAIGATLNDPLPAGSGSGVTWSIDNSVGTPDKFALGGSPGSQTLSLASGTLPAGADYTVHVVAQTSQTECSVYDNTATLTTTNASNPDPAHASESCAFRVDLSITKAGSPATQTLGAGNITWTIVVTNNGPDTDTGVTIADPMPGGNTFVSATTTQGSCTGGAILNCNLGTMAAGATVTITLVTTPSAAGAQTNTATVAGDRPETNTANNQATATVQVTAPFVPPPVYCVAVSKVTPQQLFVGRNTKLTIHVTQHNKAVKGIHVQIKGPKINVRTKASDSKGLIKTTVKMKKAGILIFSPIASKRCNTKRVGVTNVFTPPVTG
jgi:uncharacterized repeat protein (TIGR01451 family)